MPAWEIKLFGGVTPIADPRLIGDNAAQESVNADLSSGQLRGLFHPVLVQDFTATAGPIERAYLFPGPVATDGTSDPIWVPFSSKYTSVVRSPLANDDLYRLYWTTPGALTPYWNTYARFKAGSPPYSLGTIAPTAAPVLTSATGGTTTVPQITRAYAYTWINQYGEESVHSPPSNDLDGPPDATWHVTNLPAAAPANPSGRNYPPITQLALFRTITGQDTGTQYYEVTRWNLPGPTTYNDSVVDDAVVNNRVLETIGWNNPPDFIDGLTSFPGGMLMGFTNNTIHFCEPDRPHTWPRLYDQSVHYNVITLAVWQQYLIVLTSGYPSTGSGSSPSNFVLVQSQVPEPCVSRGSVVTDLLAVYYASQNGLIQISGYGMSNQTLQLVDKEKWVELYKAREIFACHHRSQYLAINGTDSGFIIDYADQRLGFEDLTTFKDVVCIWNDEYFGNTYVCANKKIYLWDDPAQPRLRYRWRSKRFFSPFPISLGAVQVTLGPEVDSLHSGQFSTPPLDNGDPSLALPDGAWGVLRYYAGPDFQLVMEHTFDTQQDIFRLPKGFRAFDHQIEVVSMASIYSIQLATTMSELRGV